MVAEAQGIVVSEPRLFPGGSSSFELRLSQLRVDNADLLLFLLQVEGIEPPPAYGDQIWLRGTLRKIEPPRNPGQFDFAAWAARRNIFARIVGEQRNDMQILQRSRAIP